MDKAAVDYTRNHYDRHAKGLSHEEAIAARNQSASLPLKKYHNLVKRSLLRRFAYQAESLLDLACGRGGDIWKWMAAEVRYVKGLDLSPGEVREARERFATSKQQNPESELEADFEATSELGVSEVRLGRLFDVVTVMFAIHYFFESEQSANAFFHNVAINLKDGGYFFGTVPDGRIVTETIKNGGKWPSLRLPMLQLKALYQGETKTFGSAYSMAIGDTVTEGHEGDSGGSYEYLVFRSTLLGIASAHGFQPVIDYADTDLQLLFNSARLLLDLSGKGPDSSRISGYYARDAGLPCKHFAPPYRDFMDAPAGLLDASKINMAFVFQKTGGKPARPPPPVPPEQRGPGKKRGSDGAGQPPPKRRA